MSRNPPARVIVSTTAAIALSLAAIVACSRSLAAQPTKPAAAQPAPVATLPPAPAADPQRTTASFGDWIVRCEQPGAGVKLCEAAQIASNQQGQPVAQIAIGRAAKGDPLRMTLLVPPSVTLAAEPRFLGRDNEKNLPALELGWRRCLPGGCLADTVLRDDAVTKLRALTDPYRLTFLDGAARDAALPFSPKGLAQALDALAREETR